MLSIIVPTKSEEKVLAKTLGALRGLRSQAYELIVSDGNSTDSTIAIAQEHADVVVQAKPGERQNIAMGKNAGAAAASGRYLVFVDADVQIPNIDYFFDQLVSRFEDDAELVSMTVFMKVFPSHATLSDKLFFTIVNWVYFVSNNILQSGAASGEFQMVRADAFRQVGGFNARFPVGEDNDLFKKLAKIGKTRVAASVHVLHTSRRAHKVGWPTLIALWWLNSLSNKLLGRSFSAEWKVIR
jgi:glycosyltransferase involved in cell wall biosynthesis